MRSFSPSRSAFVVSALLGASVLFAQPAAYAQTLTDITLVRLDSNNNTLSPPEGFNTRGSSFDGGLVSNLYLLSNGVFVNNGDGSGVNLAIALNTPGTYTFAFAGENVNNNTNTPLGINFFFNNNITTPGISARGPQSGGFVANGNATNTPSFAPVAGANTLSFFNNGRQITLTNFAFQTTGGPDQVSSFNNVSNGLSDTNGTFTLTVSGGAAAPEPGSFTLLGTGLVPLAGLIARRRAAKTVA